MVAFNDRRESIGSGDFNNPSGTFSLTTHGYDQEDRWAGMSHKDAAPEVRSYYSGQKDTKTWQEANRLAARRTAGLHQRFRVRLGLPGPPGSGDGDQGPFAGREAW
jgi:hypothetical protein